jgi:ribosomal protein L19
MCETNIFIYFENVQRLIDSEFIEEELNIQELEQEGKKKSNNYYIKLRKERECIANSFIIKKFAIGDVLEFVYFYKNISLIFSGICIAIKRKSFMLPDLSLILRNIIVRTGVEVTLSYFYNRAYKLKFLDYKRKFYTFNKNKLYFIRERLNRESRI